MDGFLWLLKSHCKKAARALSRLFMLYVFTLPPKLTIGHKVKLLTKDYSVEYAL